MEDLKIMDGLKIKDDGNGGFSIWTIENGEDIGNFWINHEGEYRLLYWLAEKYGMTLSNAIPNDCPKKD